MKTTIPVPLCIAFTSAILGCTQPMQNSNVNIPITLSLDSVYSKGKIIQASLSGKQIKTLETTMDHIYTESQAKGISAAVGMPDIGIWCSSRGVSGIPAKDNIGPDFKFYAGSVGKLFTSAVILRLIEENQFSLESPIDRWFPEPENYKNITINHLLMHTSGIVSWDNLEINNNAGYLSPDEILAAVKNEKMLFKPGEHYSYSNTGYLMLGLIIEKTTGISFREALETYIINELPLRETGVITKETQNELKVRGHHHGASLVGTGNYAKAFAAGPIIASPRDLIVFFQALMNGRIISESSLQTMFTDINRTVLHHESYYGKGVAVSIGTPVGTLIGHTGGAKGFLTALYYHPKKNLFVSVMMNDDIKPVEPAMFRLMEALSSL